MNWIELLNQVTGRIVLGETTIEARRWAYSSHLADNIPHRHTYFEVCLVGNWGKGQYRVEGVPYPLLPGTLFLARPGVLHQIVNNEQPNMELYWVCFQWAGTGRQGGTEGLFEDFARSSILTISDSNRQFASLWSALRATSEVAVQSNRVDIGTEIQLRSLMTALLLAIAQSGSNPASHSSPEVALSDVSDSLIREAVRYIHNNLHRPLTVGELAQIFQLSERQMTRLFVQFSGTPPATYITRARIDRAAALLLKTDDPIKQIASLLGYDDIHHFTRVFTRVLGCPPGQFRQNGGGPGARSASEANEGDLVW